MDDAIEAIIDRVIKQSNDIEGRYYALSMVGLYRLFLRAYNHDAVAARNGFAQYMRGGEIPAEVLAYCDREQGKP